MRKTGVLDGVWLSLVYKAGEFKYGVRGWCKRVAYLSMVYEAGV